MAKLHWSKKKTVARPSLYQQTIGNPYLRSMAIEFCFRELDKLEADGKKDSGYWRKLVNDLHSMGEGDYSPHDHGCDIADDPRYEEFRSKQA